MEREIELGGGRRRYRFEVGLCRGGSSASRQRRHRNTAGQESLAYGRGLQAAPPRLLLRGVDFAPDTQEPDATEKEDGGGLDFVPDSEDDRSYDDLSQYNFDELKFVPDSVLDTEEEVVPDSVLDDGAEDPISVQAVEKVEESARGQLAGDEVCFSMLRILLPAYFRIPGNENLGL